MSISIQLLSNTTQNQCICEMAKLSGSILALNYFQINNTCQLFILNNNSLVVQYYSNSSVVFYNQSFVSIIVQPVCELNCQNNGTCSFTGLCICTPQWNGTQCEIPICTIPCENSGVCTAPNVCTCSYGWTGAYCQIVKTVLWAFDGTLNDTSNQFVGTSSSSAVYVTGINDYGTALALDGNIAKCVNVYPYLNMSYASFTWELWIYPTVMPADDSTFISQCRNTTLTTQCLILTTRNDMMWFAFSNNSLGGITNISAYTWSHLAFVYDDTSKKRFMYRNGILEATQVVMAPLQTASTNVVFGCRTTIDGNSYKYPFVGYMDQVLYNSRMKNASEILNDATLVFYFPFRSSTPLIDSGPNLINGSWGNGAASIASGVVDQAVNFSVSGSYFQVTGLVLLGTSNWPFSLSVWFKTNSLDGGGTIAHLSASTSGTGWCIRFIGLTATGTLELQIFNGASNLVLSGPIMPINVWIHVVYTFSSSNGMGLYINGTLYTSKATSYSASGYPDTLIFGNPLGGTSCGSSYPNKQFYGSLDEIRLYSRELTSNEIAQLYLNP
ncbi:unnamed protein product [Adineta ricciae]|uniref:EGF-like domain-containing protein n=1 Tax=Adineta ricciae TaxID=249248 RepID=A0A815M8M1_ADIRI|nr:unnamed protein product [Adineta ricciae]CAF1417167.1 unnamed protein product [Adineta ricciae]